MHVVLVICDWVNNKRVELVICDSYVQTSAQLCSKALSKNIVHILNVRIINYKQFFGLAIVK